MLNVRSSVNNCIQHYIQHCNTIVLHDFNIFIILLAILLAITWYFTHIIYMLTIVNMLALLAASNNFDNYLAIMIIIVIALHT